MISWTSDCVRWRRSTDVRAYTPTRRSGGGNSGRVGSGHSQRVQATDNVDPTLCVCVYVCVGRGSWSVHPTSPDDRFGLRPDPRLRPGALSRSIHGGSDRSGPPTTGGTRDGSEDGEEGGYGVCDGSIQDTDTE